MINRHDFYLFFNAEKMLNQAQVYKWFVFKSKLGEDIWRPIIISISIRRAMNKKQKNTKLSHQQQKKLLQQFLKSYEDFSTQPDDESQQICGRKKYLCELQKLANMEKKVLQVRIDDLERFYHKATEKTMIQKIRKNTYRYLKMFESIAVDLLPDRNKELNPEQEIEYKYCNFLNQQRSHNLLDQNSLANNERIPASTKQKFDVAIVFGKDSKVKQTPISQLKAQNIGSLVSLRGIVIRTSQVRPEVQVATYVCDVCGAENYQQVMGGKYPQMLECKSAKCQSNKMRGKLTFYPGHSKFRSFQEIKIQQTPEQLRRGAIPKSTFLELRGSMVNSVSPGDIVKVQGILLPVKKNLNPLYEDLSFQNSIYVTQIQRQKKKYVQLQISQQQKQMVETVRQQLDQQTLYKRLANSIAPEIYGLQIVKKALLLQMAGGVTIQTSQSMRIRGQINVSIFGDPGIAKSQLLKHISYISPRAVYTTGKGSSGVGLTAAIVTDPVTKQLSLEAGALVLADMGVCCIDQFDKMDEYDRTAIHEVMQQQTVSITKAGIITTLNSRTAILAAANPAFGRYNKSESIQRNLNLPAALLSRFDLIFILLDQADRQKDRELASHIGRVHQLKNAPREQIFDQSFLRTYISLAKQYQPVIPASLNQEIVRKYVEKRQEQKSADSQEQEYITMRSFLALIRLSQARAKLRFSNQVCMTDFLESLEIIGESQESVKIKSVKSKANETNFIYESLKSMCLYSREHKVNRDIFFNKMISKGYTSQQVTDTIEIYKDLGVVSVFPEYILILESKQKNK